ncbi:hypothetical protein IWGMT90018_18590 [Mycobacterium kiyosense]|nr:hypothetical protein IWGMT90018_18590 [Mycobacterium kiyosense]
MLCKHEWMSQEPAGAVARWSILVLSLFVTASSFLFINGVAFLIPRLEAARGIPLTQAGLLASMPSWGMVVTLIAWGYVLDRIGERIVLALGSALTAAASYAAASVHSLLAMGVFLFLGGMAAASANSAGGRLVSGWFPPQQRGLAMGIRQTAQPFGIALGAMAIPELAEGGAHAGLMFPAVVCAVAAVVSLIGVVNPPRKPRAAASDEELSSPYLGSGGAVANPHRFRAADDAADGDGDVHAGLADQPPPLDGGGGRRTGDHLAADRRRRPDPGRPLVGSDRLPDAAGPHHRRRVGVDAVSAGPRRPRGFPLRRVADDPRLGDCRAGQRPGSHRHHRVRRAVLERTRAGHAEHHAAVDGRGRSTDVRCADHRGRLPAGVGAVRPVPAGCGAAGACRVTATRVGD